MTRLLEVLSRPNLSENAPAEEIYRAACIGAVTLLYEAGDSKSLETAVLRGASPETRARALAAIRNLTRGPEDIRTRAVRVLYELAVLHGVPAAAASASAAAETIIRMRRSETMTPKEWPPT